MHVIEGEDAMTTKLQLSLTYCVKESRQRRNDRRLGRREVVGKHYYFYVEVRIKDYQVQWKMSLFYFYKLKYRGDLRKDRA
jgi:hypothetical protein